MAIPKILEHERKLKNIQDGDGSLAVQTAENTASGDFAFAEGMATTASGVASHAEGTSTTASGDYSHAEGWQATTSAYYSHAEGFSTEASGGASHAEGCATTASGDNSHAEGTSTTASSKSQHAQGEYNIIEEVEDGTVRGTYAHIVGNGTATNARSNAHTLDWDGNAWFAGDIYVGSTSGTNKDEGSKKLATKEYVDNSGGTFYADISSDSSLSQIDSEYVKGKSIVLTIPTGGLIQQSSAQKLPDGYTALEYIETDGNAYIATNYYPNNNTSVIMDFQFTRDVAAHLFGGRTASQTNAFAICFESNFAWCLQMGNSIYNGGTFDRTARHVIRFNSSYFSIDDTTSTVMTYDGSFTSGGPLYIGACSNSTIPDENMQGKIYQFVIYDNGQLRANLIPAKNSSEIVGLYDFVMGQFYSSAGTAAFTAGPEINVNNNLYCFTYSTRLNDMVTVGTYNFTPHNNCYFLETTYGKTLSGPTDGMIYHNQLTFLTASDGYYRPIRVSTQEPTASDGNIGDIWIVYTE